MDVTQNFFYHEKSKGHDTSKHVLACFGGAGAQHACAIAKSLGKLAAALSK